MDALGKWLMGMALLLFVVGTLLWGLGRLGGGLLPGDVVWRRGNFTIVVPIVTSFVLRCCSPCC
jgi:hypothetical protein